MTVLLVPTGAPHQLVTLTTVEQIVKTSGNLLTSFLVQGGGFKFYQGGGSSTEALIIRAKLLGSTRFYLKSLLENLRVQKAIVFIFSGSFGFETGFVINSFEVNINNRDRDSFLSSIFNCTISLQKVKETSGITRALQGLIFTGANMFAPDLVSDVRSQINRNSLWTTIFRDDYSSISDKFWGWSINNFSLTQVDNKPPEQVEPEETTGFETEPTDSTTNRGSG